MHSARFRKSQKVLYHSTLMDNWTCATFLTMRQRQRNPFPDPRVAPSHCALRCVDFAHSWGQ